MSDEDVLPEHHPLQHYLTELGLSEPTEKSTTLNSLITPLSNWKFLVADFARQSAFLFYFADLLRPHILKILYVLNFNDQTLIVPTSLRPTNQSESLVVFYLALIPLLVLGLLQSSSTILWLISAIGFCLFLLSMGAALWLLMICVTLKWIKQTIQNCHINMRQCVIFLHELHLHSTDLPDSEFVCPTHQLLYDLWQSLKTYNNRIIHLCLAVQRISHSVVPLSNVPKTNLEFIMNQLQTPHGSDRPVLLSDCKMLRELVGILHAELIGALLGPISSLPTRCICKWFKLGLSVYHWNCALRQFAEKLSYMNQMRGAIESGRLTLAQTLRTSQSLREPDSEDSLTPSRRMIQKLLLQLLAAVTKTQELAHFVQNPTGSLTDSRLSTMLSYIKLQLQAIELSRTDLERLLLNREAVVDAADSHLNDSQPNDLFVSSTSPSRQPPVLVPAADLTPEDEFVEDIAVGDANVQRNIEDLGNDISILPTMRPLHASVLSELRLAIADRHLQMQQRERVALQKHLNPSAKPESEDVKKESPLIAVSEAGDHSFHQQSVPPCQVSDPQLESFFSVSAFSQPAFENSNITTSSRFHVPSAVRKRSALFRRFAQMRTTHETSERSSTVSQVRNPLSSPSFAMSLLAQRRTIGYATEECFTSIGTGSEDLPSIDRSM